MLTLAVTNLAVRSFRNLDRVDVSFCPGLNVLSGENGQGKTNILEAIYVVATSKSFRSKKSSDLISYGQSVANAKFSILEGGGAREQSLGIVRGSLRVLCDGNKPQTLAAYALLSPVVVFHPGEVVLSMGGGPSADGSWIELLCLSLPLPPSIEGGMRVLFGSASGLSRCAARWRETSRNGKNFLFSTGWRSRPGAPKLRGASRFQRSGPSIAWHVLSGFLGSSIGRDLRKAWTLSARPSPSGANEMRGGAALLLVHTRTILV